MILYVICVSSITVFLVTSVTCLNLCRLAYSGCSGRKNHLYDMYDTVCYGKAVFPEKPYLNILCGLLDEYILKSYGQIYVD